MNSGSAKAVVEKAVVEKAGVLANCKVDKTPLELNILPFGYVNILVQVYSHFLKSGTPNHIGFITMLTDADATREG